jgi:hypothetical protein
MTQVFEIPLNASPERFPIVLNGTTYTLVFQFRNPGLPGSGGTWVLDIGDSFGNAIVCGIPLITGTNLLGQYDYLGFAGMMVVISDGEKYAAPTFDNLGINSHVYWVIEP